MQLLTSTTAFDELLELPAVLIYKHSTRCPISLMAYQEMDELHDARPDVPVRIIDVHESRPVARYVSERTGIVHHSPQVILLVEGEPVWAVSHFEVRAASLAERLDAASHVGR
jgi:bacillithiol system protein YtxJ